MSETQEEIVKTPLDLMHDANAQLKEMEHYSRSNIEKLATTWFLFDDQLKEKSIADKLGDLLNAQNSFQDLVIAISEDINTRCTALADAAAA